MALSRTNTVVTYLRIIYSANLYLGILPITNVQHVKVASESSKQVTNYECHYIISYNGIGLWCLSLLINFYGIYTSYLEGKEFLKSNLQTCFQRNFCLTLVEILTEKIQPVGIVLLGITYLFTKRICLTQADNFLRKLKDEELKRSPVSFLCCSLLAYSIINVRYLWKTNPFSAFVIYYNILTVIATDCMITTLCYIMEKTYFEINRKIDSMSEIKIPDERELSSLMESHWAAGNLAASVNTCFGLNLLLFWPFYIIRVITLLINFAEYLKASSRPFDYTFEIINHVLQVVHSIFTITYYLTRGTQLAKEAQRTKVCLQKLLLSCNIRSENIEKVINIFQMKISGRDVKLTAGGYVTINMQLIQTLIGLILTYWIVLVQFRTDEESQN